MPGSPIPYPRINFSGAFFSANNAYSLPDVKSVLYHPDTGTANLHLCRVEKITASSAGDPPSYTTAHGMWR